jgi:hypothetical protein
MIIKLFSRILLLLCFTVYSYSVYAQEKNKYFKIQFVDEQTGRGVPLVELATLNGLKYYTDSKGIIAFWESTLMNMRVAFSVFSYGYKALYHGESMVLTPSEGKDTIIKLKRINIAERLYRITGQDIYGQSALLGLPIPIQHQALNGKVLGQDTYIETLYKGKIYWFWGDTGGPADFNFKASGATSEVPGKGGLDPDIGIDLKYFVDSTGFSKPMCPFPGKVLIWIEWLATLKDTNGNERLYARYTTINGDQKPGINGIAVFNDTTETFQQVKIINEWYGQEHNGGHPFKAKIGNQEYLYIINYSGIQRVPANIESILDPKKYEQFTCFAPRKPDDTVSTIVWDIAHQPVYSWKSNAELINRWKQKDLLKSGIINANQGLWQFQDIITGKSVPIEPHSVFWNEYRKKWVMIGYKFTDEVWFLEGDAPTGPWVYGRKIVSHEKDETHQQYDFYNLGQHPFFDQEGGKLIYFEGTYTTGFSGNKSQTPLYDYNQIMYRLSMDDKRLSLPAPVYLIINDKNQETYFMREGVDSLNLWTGIKNIPFFAIPVKEGYDDLIPVYSIKTKFGTQLSLKPSTHDAQLLFYALPADTGINTLKNANSVDPEERRKQSSQAIVFLYEYKNIKSNNIFYSTESNIKSEFVVRKPEPICKVWYNPLSTLALDYLAVPTR